MQVLSDEKVKKILNDQLNEWNLKDGVLVRVFKTKDWKHSFFYAQIISFIAEKFNHHPDLTIKYREVMVSLYTHSAGGITQKDIDLAREIDKALMCMTDTFDKP